MLPRVVASLLICLSLPAADLVLLNGRVWTGDSWAEALAVTSNRIEAVGTTQRIRKLITPKTQVIDARSRLVTPGFNDAHIHFLEGSLGLAEVDLTGICTLPTIQAAIRKYADAHPGSAWILGHGWEYSCFPGNRLPEKADLDSVVPDRPVYLRAYDGHTGWANSAALRKAGITKDTKFSRYGEIVRDAHNEPTGCLKEGAQSLVKRAVPAKSREEQVEALLEGLKLAASLGITSMQNADGDAETLSLMEELLNRGKLSARFAMSARAATPIPTAIEWRRRHNDERLRVAAVKFFLDGVIESHTAAMLMPYSDKPDTSGTPAFTQEKYNEALRAWDKAGFQIYTHAIGDRAVRMALDGSEQVLKSNGPHDARFRIEHIETVDPTDLPRFAQLGVMASMEPIHADPDSAEVWSAAVGPQRLPFGFAWQSLLKAKARMVFSSDWPASISVDPIRGIHTAVNRQTTAGKPEDGWLPRQRVDVETALRGYTTQAAYASFEESRKGSLKPGMLADFIVLSRDLFQIPSREIYTTHVDLTIFNGAAIFRRP